MEDKKEKEVVGGIFLTRISLNDKPEKVVPFALDFIIEEGHPLFNKVIEAVNYKDMLLNQVSGLITHVTSRPDARAKKNLEELLKNLVGSKIKVSVKIEQVNEVTEAMEVDDDLDALFLSWETLIGK